MLRKATSLTPTPAIVLILLLTAAFLAGCGGGESSAVTATPPVAQPTEEPSPTPTSGGQATEQGTPTAGPDATTGSGLSSDVQRYIDTNCSLVQEDDPETWGEVTQRYEEQFERLRSTSPPEELREYFEASFETSSLILEFYESKDPSERIDPDSPGTAFYEFINSPEYQAAVAVVQEVIDKMDRDLVIALNDAGC